MRRLPAAKQITALVVVVEPIFLTKGFIELTLLCLLLLKPVVFTFLAQFDDLDQLTDVVLEVFVLVVVFQHFFEDRTLDLAEAHDGVVGPD